METKTTNVLRLLGLIGSISAAAFVGVKSGDWVTAGGIIGAALSTAGLKGQAKVE